VEVIHQGEKVTIQRNQDTHHEISPLYAKTSRKCPPFCIQPMKLDNVETIGELELLDLLQKKSAGDDSLLIIDSRTPEWLARGTIPGSINIPWSKINPDMAVPFESGESQTMEDIMTKTFGAQKHTDGSWDFSTAKTLVLFCNGPWCEQSPSNINTLLKRGYPGEKLKWYRGGMQDWEMLGLTIVKPR